MALHYTANKGTFFREPMATDKVNLCVTYLAQPTFGNYHKIIVFLTMNVRALGTLIPYLATFRSRLDLVLLNCSTLLSVQIMPLWERAN